MHASGPGARLCARGMIEGAAEQVGAERCDPGAVAAAWLLAQCLRHRPEPCSPYKGPAPENETLSLQSLWVLAGGEINEPNEPQDLQLLHDGRRH